MPRPLERSTPRLLEPDSEDNLHRLFLENHFTDCLPIVLPTEQRVEAMLAGTSHARDEIVGRLRPTRFREFWEFDVEKVAVNAVMAGARPEYMPVILALAASGMTARHSSTTSWAKLRCNASSVMALPPYLMTTVLPWKRRMYGSASDKTSALTVEG